VKVSRCSPLCRLFNFIADFFSLFSTGEKGSLIISREPSSANENVKCFSTAQID
jgi:hypothetical protein